MAGGNLNSVTQSISFGDPTIICFFISMLSVPVQGNPDNLYSSFVLHFLLSEK